MKIFSRKKDKTTAGSSSRQKDDTVVVEDALNRAADSIQRSLDRLDNRLRRQGFLPHGGNSWSSSTTYYNRTPAGASDVSTEELFARADKEFEKMDKEFGKADEAFAQSAKDFADARKEFDKTKELLSKHSGTVERKDGEIIIRIKAEGYALVSAVLDVPNKLVSVTLSSYDGWTTSTLKMSFVVDDLSASHKVHSATIEKSQPKIVLTRI